MQTTCILKVIGTSCTIKCHLKHGNVTYCTSELQPPRERTPEHFGIPTSKYHSASRSSYLEVNIRVTITPVGLCAEIYFGSSWLVDGQKRWRDEIKHTCDKRRSKQAVKQQAAQQYTVEAILDRYVPPGYIGYVHCGRYVHCGSLFDLGLRHGTNVHIHCNTVLTGKPYTITNTYQLYVPSGAHEPSKAGKERQTTVDMSYTKYLMTMTL